MLDRSDMKLKIEEFLGKFGVHTSDIQKMKDVADAELNSALHSNSKESGNSLSQQDFILKYYSDKMVRVDFLRQNHKIDCLKMQYQQRILINI